MKVDDAGLYAEVARARQAAHAKHGDHSIERLSPLDPAWLPILVEETGEVARAMTYDGTVSLREELLDVAAVATAWIAALDREIGSPRKP